MPSETTLEELLTDAYTREEVTQALLAREDQEEAPDLHALKRALKDVPVLTLYVSAPLATASVHALGAWARREVDPHVLLEMRIDPDAAGGCLFAWKGVLHNYALAHLLEQKRAQFEERLGRILAPDHHA